MKTHRIPFLLAALFILSCEWFSPDAGMGVLHVTTQPQGCDVYLNGELQALKTDCYLEVEKADDIVLRLLNDDYVDWTDTVKFADEDTLNVDKTFTGQLAVSSNPSGAGIILDGQATSETTPYTFEEVVVGPHSLRLEYEGYASVDTTTEVYYDQSTETSFELSQEFGYIEVKSTPQGAEIWLDGSNTGYKTDHTLENVRSGSHLLKLVLEGYDDWEYEVSVDAGETKTVNAGLVPTERQTVVFEIFTATWCGYCPGAAMGAHDMHNAYPGEVLIIEHHSSTSSSDPVANSQSSSRMNFYPQATGYPTTVVDGVLVKVGGSASSSLFSDYEQMFETRKEVAPKVAITLTQEPDSYLSSTGTLHASVTNITDATVSGRIFFTITESNIPYSWLNQSTLDWVLREFIPNPWGESISLAPGENTVVSKSYTIDSAWPLYTNNENIELGCFVQGNDKEIYQAAVIEFGSALD